MRTGSSDSPCALLSNLFRLPTMPRRRRHIAQRRVQPLLVVVPHQPCGDRFGLEVVRSVVIVGFIAHGNPGAGADEAAVEAFHTEAKAR